MPGPVLGTEDTHSPGLGMSMAVYYTQRIARRQTIARWIPHDVVEKSFSIRADLSGMQRKMRFISPIRAHWAQLHISA